MPIKRWLSSVLSTTTGTRQVLSATTRHGVLGACVPASGYIQQSAKLTRSHRIINVYSWQVLTPALQTHMMHIELKQAWYPYKSNSTTDLSHAQHVRGSNATPDKGTQSTSELHFMVGYSESFSHLKYGAIVTGSHFGQPGAHKSKAAHNRCKLNKRLLQRYVDDHVMSKYVSMLLPIVLRVARIDTIHLMTCLLGDRSSTSGTTS